MTATSERGGLRSGSLTPAQAAALAYVRSSAVTERPAALATIARHLAAAAVDDPAQRLLAAVEHSRITVNFHPDRLCADGRAVAAALAEDRGPTADTLQHLKQLWHVLVRFGTAHPG